MVNPLSPNDGVVVPVTVLVEPKPWYRSKTIWWNVGTTALAILGFLMVTQASGGLPFNIDSRWLLVLTGIINIILRFLSPGPVTVSK